MTTKQRKQRQRQSPADPSRFNLTQRVWGPTAREWLDSTKEIKDPKVAGINQNFGSGKQMAGMCKLWDQGYIPDELKILLIMEGQDLREHDAELAAEIKEAIRAVLLRKRK